jgi:predicted nuclease of predicted toxin-antitoxin system
LLANENVTGTVIRELRRQGHDVLSAKEDLRGWSDEAVLRRAQTEKRLLIAHDKDFGELAFRFRLPAECGIVLFRLSGEDSERDNQRVLEVLSGGPAFGGKSAVVTDDRIRMRPFPTGESLSST